MAVPRCGWCARGIAVLAFLVAESRFEHIVRAIRPRFCGKKVMCARGRRDAAVSVSVNRDLRLSEEAE